MRKTILSMVVIVMTLAIAACGSNNTAVVNVADSTAVAADTAVAVVDSAAAVK